MMYWAMNWLRHLYEGFHEHLLMQEILHTNETTVQILSEPGRAHISKSYMWMYRTGRDGPAIVLYDYQQTTCCKTPESFPRRF